MIKTMYGSLVDLMGDLDWSEWWPADCAFERIVGAILTRQTSWENVDKVLSSLRAEGLLAPDAMAAAPLERLEALVRPAGFYRQKAFYLKSVASYFSARPLEELLSLPAEQLRAELLSLPGIGDETADTILLYVANRPRFIVDAYARRLLGCLGIKGTYAEMQALFKDTLGDDARTHQQFHGLIVEHGKRYCNKKRCSECVAAMGAHKNI